MADVVHLHERALKRVGALGQLGLDLHDLLDRETPVDHRQRVGVHGHRERLAGARQLGADVGEGARGAHVRRHEGHAEAGGDRRRVELVGRGLELTRRGVERPLRGDGVAVARGLQPPRGGVLALLHEVGGVFGRQRRGRHREHQRGDDHRDADLHARAHPRCGCAFEVRPSGLDADHEQHQRGQHRPQPHREHRPRSEQGDQREQHLGDDHQRDRFGGRPPEGHESVHQVVAPLLGERAAVTQPVQGYDHRVEQEHPEEHERREQVAPRVTRHRPQRQRAHRDGEPDGQPARAADEQRRRSQVVGEEAETGAEQTDGDRRQRVLRPERGRREHPERGAGADRRGQRVDVAEPVGGLGDHEHEHERADDVDHVDARGPEPCARHHRDDRRDDRGREGDLVSLLRTLREPADQREPRGAERGDDHQLGQVGCDGEADQWAEGDDHTAAPADAASVGMGSLLAGPGLAAHHRAEGQRDHGGHREGDQPPVRGRSGDHDGRLHQRNLRGYVGVPDGASTGPGSGTVGKGSAGTPMAGTARPSSVARAPSSSPAAT